MIKDVIFPRLKGIGSKEKNQLLMDIHNYVDKNHDKLKTMNIYERPYFTIEDKNVIYDLCNTSEDEMSALVKSSPAVNPQFKVQSGSHFGVICALLISHLLHEKDDETAYQVQLYMMLDTYGYLHSKYAKYGAKEAVMLYTISKLSNSFDLKKEVSIYALLAQNAKDLVNTYRSRLLKAMDDDIIYFVTATHTRLNGKMKKIFQQYYQNEKSGKYLNLDVESTNPEDFKIAESDSKVIFNLVDKVYINFITNKISSDIPQLAVMGSDLSVAKFTRLIDDIRMNCTDIEVRTLLSNILGYAIQYSNLTIDRIASGKFIETCKKGYSSNTISPEMEAIKKVLDKWVDDNAVKYGRRAYGKTAANNYKRSVYMYFVYAIFNESK